jgi:predicted secreted protein
MTQSIRRGAVVAAVAVTVFASPAAADSMSSPTVYTLANNGQTVLLSKGMIFKVSLKTASDGGYFWTFADKPDRAIVALVSKHVRHKAGVIGGYSHTVYTFKSVGAGSTTEKLVEKRSGAHKSIRHFTLTEKVGN